MVSIIIVLRLPQKWITYITDTDKLVYHIETVNGFQKVLWEYLDIEHEVDFVHNYLYWGSTSQRFYYTLGRPQPERVWLTHSWAALEWARAETVRADRGKKGIPMVCQGDWNNPSFPWDTHYRSQVFNKLENSFLLSKKPQYQFKRSIHMELALDSSCFVGLSRLRKSLKK